MRILLAHNSTYYPSHGGGDKSNRLLMEALAERGHEVRVVTRVERFGPEEHRRLLHELEKRGVRPDVSEGSALRMSLNGVDVRVLTIDPNLRGYFTRHIEEFDPDVIITSTDDPGQLLFDIAIRAPRARVVYLVRATIAVPFGPDASTQSTAKTKSSKYAEGVVGVSQYVAEYCRTWGGLDAVHVPISLLDKVQEYPDLGDFRNPYVSIANPCAVKGISIFLELADRMPDVAFAAVPTWGTTREDREALERRKNITILPPFDNIDDLLRITKVLLVPSVWAEARSRIVMEAMSRGIPVLASDVGGIGEAHLDVDYLIPVNPITRYRPSLDMNMVPVAEVPPQNVDPWENLLRRVVADRKHYEELSTKSREAALEYARNLNVLPFEAFLEELTRRPRKPRPAAAKPAADGLTEEKKKLLALRLRQRAAASRTESRWFSGLDDHKEGRMLLFCLPYAGGGTRVYRNWQKKLKEVATVAAVRLPGRESRFEEEPFRSMDRLVDALAEALKDHLNQPFAFFGHSMGAVVGFELARRLRQRDAALPRALYVSAARAPQFRLGHVPPPEPSDAEFLAELQRLEAIPDEVLQNEELMRVAMRALKADASLYRNYVYHPGQPLSVPIFAYGGSKDPNVRPDHIEPWAEQTSREFRRREFEGRHFFIQTAPNFLQALVEDLRSA